MTRPKTRSPPQSAAKIRDVRSVIGSPATVMNAVSCAGTTVGGGLAILSWHQITMMAALVAYTMAKTA